MFTALLMTAAMAQAQPPATPKEFVQPPAKVRVFKRSKSVSKTKPTATKPTAQPAPTVKVEPTKSVTASKVETLTAPTATNSTCPGGNCPGASTSTRSGLFGRRR